MDKEEIISNMAGCGCCSVMMLFEFAGGIITVVLAIFIVLFIMRGCS